jgi:hypothetical protein
MQRSRATSSELSAEHACVWQRGEQTAGVVLSGMGQRVELSAGEAYDLASEVKAKWPTLAAQLCEAAEDVAHFTRFDGPLPGCEPSEPEPGNYQKARRMISALERDRSGGE